MAGGVGGGDGRQEMATYHTTEQGEHLPRIAARYGFEDFRSVWNDARNAELAARRQNPNVLLPGDQIFIPDKQRKKESIATGRRHRFQLSAVAPILLRLVLKDSAHRPVADAECTLLVEGQSHQLRTDSNGMIERAIVKTAEHGQLTTPDWEAPMKIGHLDPVDQLSGQAARLDNLGYVAGPASDASDAQLRSAIEEFQCDHDLKVNGVCDPETQNKLKEAHGC